MLTYTRGNDGVHFAGDGEMLRVAPVTEAIVRITDTCRESFLQSDSGILAKETPVLEDYQVKEEAGHVKIMTKALTVDVELSNGRIQYYTAGGTLLSGEPSEKGKGRSLTEIDVYRNVFDDTAAVKTSGNVDGARANADVFDTVFDRKAYQAVLPFVFDAAEGIFGLGSHEEGYGNLRGKERHLYQQNMKAVVPFFVSTKHYGYLVDCGSLMIFEDTAAGSYLWCDCVDQLDYYFVAGDSFDGVIAGYRSLTGQVPMFPQWLFGYAQSKEKYKTQQELVEIAEEYRRREVPLDLVVQDWCSWEDGRWGQKSFDRSRYPDPDKMMEDLHSLGAKLMISIWPIMTGDGENKREMLEQHGMLGNQSTYNAFRKEARDLYWEQARRGLFDHGIDAWWCDCTEPFEKDWNGKVKPQPHQRLAINTGASKKYLDWAKINLFSLNHSRGIYEGQRGTGSDKRVANLTRSSYAGQHRYGTITWSGDITASWETLKRQIPEGVNFCAAGEPYWSVDIGGFFVGQKEQWFWSGDYPEGCEDPGYRELYTRWLQYGAFLPVMRSHGTDTPREIWRFGEPGTVFYDTIKQFIELRYRLAPYLYTLAAKITFENGTMMRALAFDFPEDLDCYDKTGEYLFGAFLVSPVTKPMYYDKGGKVLEGIEKAWEVYLPEGSDWYDFWTDQVFKGGQAVKADAPLEKMPLYVKAGAIIPMGPVVQHMEELAGKERFIHIYAGTDGEISLYEDAGDGYQYEKGEYSWIPMRWDDQKRELTLGERKGSYPGMEKSCVFTIVLHSGEGIQEARADYQGQEKKINIMA